MRRGGARISTRTKAQLARFRSPSQPTSPIVRTGRRTHVLDNLLRAAGLAPAPPWLLPTGAEVARDLQALYRDLGGLQAAPEFRPGSWDLNYEGLVVELDEELHFNRYRARTLKAPWATRLPWRENYLAHCAAHEAECLAAGQWGKRWTNDSTARMFSGGPAGDLDGAGAPRWKQRALYDAIEDTLPLMGGGVALARVATHDAIGGSTLGAMLDGFGLRDCAAVRALVERRRAPSR